MKNNMTDNYLLYIPQKKHDKWETRGKNIRLVFYHDRIAEKIVRWLFKKPRISDLELDDTGSKVWMYIDGNRTVYEIGEKLKKDFGRDFDPSYKRLIMFLNYINKKGWISFDKKSET